VSRTATRADGRKFIPQGVFVWQFANHLKHQGKAIERRGRKHIPNLWAGFWDLGRFMADTSLAIWASKLSSVSGSSSSEGDSCATLSSGHNSDAIWGHYVWVIVEEYKYDGLLLIRIVHKLLRLSAFLCLWHLRKKIWTWMNNSDYIEGPEGALTHSSPIRLVLLHDVFPRLVFHPCSYY